MGTGGEPDITALLERAAGGDAEAEGALFQHLYGELRRQAEIVMRDQPPGHTLQVTALLHEGYLKLARGKGVKWESRGHFLAVATTAMRQVLLDHARGKARGKRGKGHARVDLDLLLLPYEKAAGDVIELDDAVTRLAQLDPEAARVVELRFYGGLTTAETAEAMGLSTRTVEHNWEMARAWLHRELSD